MGQAPIVKPGWLVHHGRSARWRVGEGARRGYVAAMMAACEVAVVGAGPVGLLLAARLAQLDLDVRLLEQRPGPSQATAAVIIHPPSLDRLAALGVVEELVAAGLPICRAWVHGAQGQVLGGLRLQEARWFYPHLLSVPQAVTERLLSQRLASLLPEALGRGRRVTGVTPQGDWVQLDWQASDGAAAGLASAASGQLRAKFVVLADGQASPWRAALGIGWTLQGPARYLLLGDFPDDSGLGPEAHIFLTRAGLVEALPLAGGGRRWVVYTATPESAPALATLRARLRDQVGRDPGDKPWQAISAFSGHQALAETFCQGRVLMAGDAAHELSPIGWQGMNLGWLGAWELAACLRLILRSQQPPGRLLADWSARRRQLARVAMARSARHLALGQARHFPCLRDALVRGLLSPPLGWLPARHWSMKGL